MKSRYRHETPLDLHAPLPAQPPAPTSASRPVYHSDECSCESCCNIRDAVTRYQEAKRLYEQNGFQ